MSESQRSHKLLIVVPLSYWGRVACRKEEVPTEVLPPMTYAVPKALHTPAGMIAKLNPKTLFRVTEKQFSWKIILFSESQMNMFK